MIAEAVRRSPLADYADRFAALSLASAGELFIRELPFVSQLNLRADPKDASVMQRFGTALRFPLPLLPNTTASKGDRRAMWLAPDEWLVVAPDGQQDSLEQALRNGLDGAFASIVDVSANRTTLQIGGPRARELLSHCVPVDLDPRSFGPGRCAQTLLSKAQVIIVRPGVEPVFQIYVRRSFAGYAAEYLIDASAETIPKAAP